VHEMKKHMNKGSFLANFTEKNFASGNAKRKMDEKQCHAGQLGDRSHPTRALYTELGRLSKKGGVGGKGERKLVSGNPSDFERLGKFTMF